MGARSGIGARLCRLRQQSQRGERLEVPASALVLGVEAGTCLVLGAVLAGAAIFRQTAPLGVALVGAAGPGLQGAAALVGACFGYLAGQDLSQGLRYCSAAILVFAVAFAFYDWRPMERTWAVPALAGLIDGATGFITLSHSGWRTVDVIYLGLEVALTAAAAWAFQAPLRPRDRERAPVRRTGLVLLLCGCLLSLAPITIYKEISLGRILAELVVLIAAWQGGSATGAVLGVAAGASMDLAARGVPLYTMAYSLSGLAAGQCRGRRRAAAALTYALANGAAVLWTWDRGLELSVLYEGLLAALLFLAVPGKAMRWVGARLGPELPGPGEVQGQRLARQRLEKTAQAFKSLYDALRAAFRPPENDNDIATVFDRTASRLCRGCALRDRCWKQEYNTTFNALNDATPAMVDRGRAEGGDFPRHFADRCIHFSDFVATVNEELTALFYRRQYDARIRESRAAVCRQYAQLSDLLGAAAAELSQELAPDTLGDRRLRQRLAELGLEVRARVCRDGRGLLRVEAAGPDSGQLARASTLADLSAVLGCPLRVEQEGEQAVALIQQEPLMALAGVAAQKKSGETVSGDAGTYFKRPDGKLYLLLCDGMGSGPLANRESTLAVRLLEELLQAGVDSRQALGTLASALALRGEETGGFTTVDLLQVDLFTGEGELYKLGAAPTYVKKGDSVQRLTGTSLPAGLGDGAGERGGGIDQFQLRLLPGDCVVMVSDGICGTGDDGWLRDRLAAFDGKSPKELARELIAQSPQAAADDRTALVVRIDRRAKQAEK